jgi:hypothetical protein
MVQSLQHCMFPHSMNEDLANLLCHQLSKEGHQGKQVSYILS